MANTVSLHAHGTPSLSLNSTGIGVNDISVAILRHHLTIFRSRGLCGRYPLLSDVLLSCQIDVTSYSYGIQRRPEHVDERGMNSVLNRLEPGYGSPVPTRLCSSGLHISLVF